MQKKKSWTIVKPDKKLSNNKTIHLSGIVDTFILDLQEKLIQIF